MTKAKKWGKNINGVMMVLNFVQVCLATMIVGLYIFDFKLGSSPFILLRHEMTWPILSRPDYLQFVKDGTGLNTTLQNYWMVIHPFVSNIQLLLLIQQQESRMPSLILCQLMSPMFL